MNAFKQVAESNQIIFSTHSHHMVNPEWLSASYIIENTAIDFDAIEDDIGYFGRSNNIKATRYPEFVSTTSTRSSYFQPVLDKLQYTSPKIVGDGPFIIVEGITDFYLLDAVAKKNNVMATVIPGSGAGSLSPLISMMIGYGKKFKVLMDDDQEGRRNASKYKSAFMLGESDIISLGNISTDWETFSLERIIDEETRDRIKDFYDEDISNKKSLRFLLSELYARGNLGTCISESLGSRLLEIFEFSNTNDEVT